ncbi:MAG: DUF6029 family protein [Bacteroidales bacterium]
MNRYFLLMIAVVPIMPLIAQQQESQKVTLGGSIQTDVLIPEEDAAIGTGKYDSYFLSNTYLDLRLNSQYVLAGARLELLNDPLPGFEPDFAGAGFAHLYVTGQCKWGSITLGDVYEQFGTGFILRNYEERSLGIDNSLRGGRVVLNPLKGIKIKGVAGIQRCYFNYNKHNSYGFDFSKGNVWGTDLELEVSQWFDQMILKDWNLTLGASFVSKYEPEETILESPLFAYNLPERVGACDFRINLRKGDWRFLGEYAYKANDPSADNGYIYKPGNALLVSGSYSKKGMSALLQAKRSDNMSFRSQRTRRGIAAYINHLPAFSMTHTYALPAMYPYATQPDGEWAFQGEFGYLFKRKTPLGGKYGTRVKINASYICSLDKKPSDIPAEGYTSPFFKLGDDTYYTDINCIVDKKITSRFSLIAMYMFQKYNQKVIEGHGVNGDMINSHIGVIDVKYNCSQQVSMRAEAQFLGTRQDKGNWIYGLYEVSLFSSLMFSISDMYNSGVTNTHYYQGAVAYSYLAHRLQLSYGRTRAGFNCSGGVCRYVPATKGVQLSYNFNF